MFKFNEGETVRITDYVTPVYASIFVRYIDCNKNIKYVVIEYDHDNINIVYDLSEDQLSNT